MLVMVVFFIAFRWIHLSTPLIRLFLLVLILLLMPTLNFLPVWFALSLLRFRLPSRLPMRSEERFSRNAETDLVCRLQLEKKKDVRRHEEIGSVDVGNEAEEKGEVAVESKHCVRHQRPEDVATDHD